MILLNLCAVWCSVTQWSTPMTGAVWEDYFVHYIGPSIVHDNFVIIRIS